MKIISILILLSISFNAQADHDGRLFEFDKYNIFLDHEVTIYIYNKSTYPLSPTSYVWKIDFEDGSSRKYKTKGSYCGSYSDCAWTISLNKKGATKVNIAH